MMKRSGKSVTMKEVAKAAGLSAAAVSLALRDHPSIPESTRRKVREVAEDLGYVKNPLLMALTAHRSESSPDARSEALAFLTNQVSEEAFFSTPHLRRFFEGFQQRAAEYGYAVKLVVSEDRGPQELDQFLAEIGSRALVIGAWNPGEDVPALDWTRYAVARIESLNAEPQTVSICNDQMHTVGLAYERLRELGYRRIGMVTGKADELYSGDLFLAGCLVQSSRLDLADEVPPLFFEENEDYQSECDRLAEWIDAFEIDAVVSNWGQMIERAASRGIRMPEEVAFASLCLTDASGAIAGVRQKHEQVGQLAADRLVTRLRSEQFGGDKGATTTYVKGEWRDGASAPPRNLR